MTSQPTTRGIILAAGRGSRMLAATEDRPKCLVELSGRALLDWQIAALRAAGVEEIALVGGYRAAQLEGRTEALFVNPRWQETNMVMSLACAREWLQESPCLVSYADIVYGTETVRALSQSQGEFGIAFDPHWQELWELRFDDPLSDAESFRWDGRQYLLEIGRRAARVEEIEGQYLGLLRFEPSGWGKIEDFLQTLPEERRARLDMTSMLQALLERGEKIRAVPIAERWLEVDSGEDLEKYQQAGYARSPDWFQRSPGRA